ncbi:hypothetical protein DUI87_22351 [Hirundo rustica rustica]|uniref:Uncharacterized protein n=1 Tax=Hirundo rustica rustica TaxID=333673 RepID=A0A3M0JK74_HIRRU|nr:hypothetical protein DUI87_22351 [Hirundo rustica rustica]
MSQKQPVQELNMKHPASAEHGLAMLREASHQSLRTVWKQNFPNQCKATAKEEKQEENTRAQELCPGNKTSDNEMSQAEEKRPQELYQKEDYTKEEMSQAERIIRKGFCKGKTAATKSYSNGKMMPSGTSTTSGMTSWAQAMSWIFTLTPMRHSALSAVLDAETAAAESVPDPHSTSPTTAGATGSEPAGAAMARAAEEEDHCAHPTPKAQEDEIKASPAFVEQLTGTEAESQAAALHSPCSPLSPLPSWPEAHSLSRAQAAHSQCPSRFRRALRALSRLCCCPCMGGRPED